MLEHCYDTAERAEYVRKHKPKNEQKVRAEHFVVVPDELVPKYLRTAWARWEEARVKLREACATWNEATANERMGGSNVRESWVKLGEADTKCMDAIRQASKSPKLIKYLKANTPFAWNGESLIFPKAK